MLACRAYFKLGNVLINTEKVLPGLDMDKTYHILDTLGSFPVNDAAIQMDANSFISLHVATVAHSSARDK